nr:helix-turn-helix domain-containing protein [Fictibacillus sp. FJAT-27399]
MSSGLEAARARGRKGGRPPKEVKRVELAISLYDSKRYSINQIKEMTGVSRSTLYRYLEKR